MTKRSVLAVLLWATIASAEEPPLLVPRHGQPYAATLMEIGGGRSFRFDVGGTPRRVPRNEMVVWGSLPDSGSRSQFLLADGSSLTADLWKVATERLVAESELWGRVLLSRGETKGVMLEPPLDPTRRDRLRERLQDHVESQDRLWLANGDELAGRLLPTDEDEDTSLFGPTQLRFSTGGGSGDLTLDIEDVTAIAFARPPGSAVRPPQEVLFVGFRDGTCLTVDKANSPGDQLQLQLFSGTQLSADPSRILPAVVLLQPVGPHVTYLSDVDPLDYTPIAFLDTPWPYKRDQNVLGGRLRVGRRLYLKGLGMHSTSRLVYDLDGSYRTFRAELALDDSAGRRGSVVYRVLLEVPAEQGGKSRWDFAFESPMVRGGDPPLRMDLDVRDAKRLVLVVDFADRGNVRDRADWLHACLVK